MYFYLKDSYKIISEILEYLEQHNEKVALIFLVAEKALDWVFEGMNFRKNFIKWIRSIIIQRKYIVVEIYT